MSILIDIVATVFIAVGSLFFVTGVVALVRLPDPISRIHALTKVDTLGLGFVVLGLLLWVPSWAVAIKLILCWLLVLISGSTACYLVVKQVAIDKAGSS